MKLYYRLCQTDDPEERLEDAALWKALHDEFRDGISVVPWDAPAPADGYLFGRGKRMEWVDNAPLLPVPDSLDYWNDPVFLGYCGRSFKLCDWQEAKVEVDRLHADGKDAFVKSIKTKHFLQKIPRGAGLAEALGDMSYEFLDLPSCLMVQEFVDMVFERRFVCIDRKIVTHSPIAVHLTPIDVFYGYSHFLRPTDRAPHIYDPQLVERMLMTARDIAATMACPHAIVDLAVSDDEVVAVEFNPMRIGQFGLYACNVRLIARATRSLVGAISDGGAA